MKFLQLNFIPRSADLALLVLRVWLGLTMLINHGFVKLMAFDKLSTIFPDPIGLGQKASLTLAIAGEIVGSILLVLGLWTRFGALVLMIVMSVAFFITHGMALSGPKSGEPAFLFLAGFVVLFLAGGGRFALDRKLGGGA